MALADIPLRAYFAAHAPAVPSWFAFEATVPEVPSASDLLKQEPIVAGLTQMERENLRDWLRGDLPYINRLLEQHPELVALVKKLQLQLGAARAAREEAITRNEADRWFAWRWHYADRMLADMAGAQG